VSRPPARPTRAQRVTRPAGPPPAPVCTCRRAGVDDQGRPALIRGGRPYLVATFRNEALVAVELVHWAGRDKCPMPVEELDPARYGWPPRPVVSGARGTVESYTNTS